VLAAFDNHMVRRYIRDGHWKTAAAIRTEGENSSTGRRHVGATRRGTATDASADRLDDTGEAPRGRPPGSKNNLKADYSGRMKVSFNILGALLVLFGAIWFHPGINILPGSFMTGQIRWAVYGGIAVVAGVALLVVAHRRRLGR
jgi:hypothetical protein